jgi:lysozyme family protein
MSYFVDAYSITMHHEGGYVNDPDDVGGETYKGIARRYNPDWEGWGIVDMEKSKEDFPKCLEFDESLQRSVKTFYKQRYFDPFVGDEMPRDLALEMFDTAVNMGVGRAVKFLQISLNILNRNQKLYKDMVVDSSYGPTTNDRLKAYLTKDGDTRVLVKMLNILQGAHYIEYMNKSPKQEKFARGWFKRVSISK